MVSKISCSDRLFKTKNHPKGPNGEKVVHEGKVSGLGVKLITVMKAHKLLRRGCEGFSCNVVKIEAAESSLEDTPAA